ncbi:MAG: hypothetical protein HYX63_19880 [Gammaproteobacteria bacterium]|nr:hypothetical protein [Gammaproteobacteria bacterium]
MRINPRRVRRWAALHLLVLGSCSLIAAARAADAPTLDMLEFLGEWQDANGEVLDPSMFEDSNSSDRGNTATAPKRDDD